MKKLLTTVLIAASALAAPVAAAGRDTPDVQLHKLIGNRVAGKPTSCINLASITSSQVIDGKAIVYGIGSRLYVNEPRSGADRLDRDDVLVTRTIGSRLCRIDNVRLVSRSSGFPRGFVILGDFVPYSHPKRAG